MGVTFLDKVQYFALSSVGQVEEILKSKLSDKPVECFNELISVNFPAGSGKNWSCGGKKYS